MDIKIVSDLCVSQESLNKMRREAWEAAASGRPVRILRHDWTGYTLQNGDVITYAEAQYGKGKRAKWVHMGDITVRGLS